MLVTMSGFVNGLDYVMNPGDIIAIMEADVQTINNAGNQTFTGAQIAFADIIRTGNGAGYADIFPSADDMVKSLIGSNNKISPPDNMLYGAFGTQSVALAWPANLAALMPGISFRRTIASGVAFANTPTIGAGGTLVGTTVIPASSWRDFLIRILNSSPAVTLSATTTNANAVLTNVDTTLINNVTQGMLATGTGIGAAPNAVVAINRDIGTITLAVNSSATANNIGVLFTPSYQVRGFRAGTPV